MGRAKPLERGQTNRGKERKNTKKALLRNLRVTRDVLLGKPRKGFGPDRSQGRPNADRAEKLTLRGATKRIKVTQSLKSQNSLAELSRILTDLELSMAMAVGARGGGKGPIEGGYQIAEQSSWQKTKVKAEKELNG